MITIDKLSYIILKIVKSLDSSTRMSIPNVLYLLFRKGLVSIGRDSFDKFEYGAESTIVKRLIDLLMENGFLTNNIETGLSVTKTGEDMLELLVSELTDDETIIWKHVISKIDNWDGVKIMNYLFYRYPEVFNNNSVLGRDIKYDDQLLLDYNW